MKNELIILILISVILGSIAQLTLKSGMNQIGSINLNTEIIKALLNPLVITGLMIYAVSSITWVMILSKSEVSYAYPFASLGYVIVAILGWLVMNETINLLRIIGISVIITGVIIVSKS